MNNIEIKKIFKKVLTFEHSYDNMFRVKGQKRKMSRGNVS